MCVALITALTLLAGPPDAGPVAREALDALLQAPPGSDRSALCRTLAVVALPHSPDTALEALLLGIVGADSVPLAGRAQVESVLREFGDEPLSESLHLSRWKDVIARRALARLLTLSLSRALAVVNELKLPKECLAYALADAAHLRVAAQGGTAGGEAAALALDLVSGIDEPSDDLLRAVVEAVMTTDPEAGVELCLRAGPARAVACEVRCESAPDAATAISAASGIVEPARRCEVLIDWLRASGHGGDSDDVQAAARSAAEAVPNPATQAALLAELARVRAGGALATSLIEQAARAAAAVADPGERAIAFATVAASAAPVEEGRARELLAQSLALTRSVSGEGPRARVLRDIGVAIGPALPADALKLATSLGSTRPASKAEVLISVLGTSDPGARRQAILELLKLVDAWDTSPAEKLSALTRARARLGPDEESTEALTRDTRSALDKRIGYLLADRADRLTDAEERVLTFIEAADVLRPLDTARASQALAGALESAARTGEADRVRQALRAAAAADEALPLKLAGSVADPKLRALSLGVAGDVDGAQAAAMKVDGAWGRAEALLTVAECAPSVERVRTAVGALSTLAQVPEREALALRAVEAALASSGEARWDAAAEAGALAGTVGLARVQLKLAEAMVRVGRDKEALDRMAEASQLIDQAGRPDALVADLALVREQVGHDGLTLVAAIRTPLERARALVAILGYRGAGEAAATQ